MAKEYLDINRNPIQSGFYKKRKSHSSSDIFFINLEEDYYEIINRVVGKVNRKGKISERVGYYFSGLEPIDIQPYIDFFQQKVDIFKSRLEQIAQS